MRFSTSLLRGALLSALLLSAGLVQAASVSISPDDSTVNLAAGTTVLDIILDFTGEPTIGGSIDIDVGGPVSIAGFAPSAFFQNLIDTEPTFNWHGTTGADNDYLIRAGSFDGLEGLQTLGQITLNLLGLGTGNLGLAHNSAWEGFFTAVGEGSLDTPSLMNVTLNGATINVVPVPAAAWLFGSALGLLLGVRRRLTMR